MKNILSTTAIIFLFISGISNAQDITNTLGAGGLFKVKDVTTDFFTLNQTNGTIILPLLLGGNQQGSIFKDTDRFLHTYYGTGTVGGNTFLGANAGNFTMSGSGLDGSYNTGVGYSSLTSNTTGYDNSAFGYTSLTSNSTGYNNSAFGLNSLMFNTTGYDNSAFGTTSLLYNQTGFYNSAFGMNSLRSNDAGYSNSAFGFNSLFSSTTGYENSAFGLNSLYLNTTGYQNSACGVSSLFSNTTGAGNSACGFEALFSSTTGFGNSACGFRALYTNTLGYTNSAFGYLAGLSITTGSNLTCIGSGAEPSSGNATNQITLGDAYVTSLRCAVITITSLSDRRDKRNIKDLSVGLDFIAKLKPREFNWDKREWYDGNVSDGSKMNGEPTAGFIAQELDEVQTTENAEWLNLVLKDNPEKWEATPGNLLPIMVKAIQELKINNKKLEIEKDTEIAELKTKNQNLEARLSKFEEAQTILINRLEQLESSNETLKVSIVQAEKNNQ